jgi:hypothetical protein
MPPFSRASRRRLDSVVSSDRPPLSITPLETLAEMVAWGGDTESDVRGSPFDSPDAGADGRLASDSV